MAIQSAQGAWSSEPVSSQLDNILLDFKGLSMNLFSILSSSSPGTATAVYLALSELDARLARLLTVVAEHQIRCREIQTCVTALKSADASWRRGAFQLYNAVQSLEDVVTTGTYEKRAIHSAGSRQVQSSVLLGYARLLAPFTSAPPASLLGESYASSPLDPSGRSLPPGALPPFPTEITMRRGLLQFGLGEDSNQIALGEIGDVGVRKIGKDEQDKGPGPVNLANSTRDAPLIDAFDFELDLNPEI